MHNYSENPIEQEQIDDFYFDPLEIQRLDEIQDRNLDELSLLLKDLSLARENHVQIFASEKLEESKILFYQTHDEYLQSLSQMKTASETDHQKNLKNAVLHFKKIHTELQNAFENYRDVIKRSYQN